MWVEPIGVATAIVGLIILQFGPSAAVWALVPATLLGSAGALLFTGNGTIQPAHLLLAFAVPTIFLRRSNLREALTSITFPNEGFWLLTLTVYSVIGAWFLPRILAGVTQVNAVGVSAYGISLQQVPLGATSGNLTQSIYMIADAACFFAILAVCRESRGAWMLAKALVVYSVANIAFAAIDLITYWTQTAYLLDFMRNAQYVIHSDEAVDGLKRISGSFTETSAFAYASIGSLAFTVRLWLAGVWPRVTLPLSIISLGLLAISTSTTALVATPVLLVCIYGAQFVEAVRRRATFSGMAYLMLGPLLLVTIGLILALTPMFASTFNDYLNTVVFQKSGTQSGIERASWNVAAVRNFVETGFLGGGLGSMRASSFAFAALSNLGAIGVTLILAFYFLLFFGKRSQRRDKNAVALRSAARTACLGLLIAACISGAMVDLGLPFYIFAGIACSRMAEDREEDVSWSDMRLAAAPAE